jgi:hypothetical protein
MSAAREKDQADFDLERFIDMFDEALTSQDPRVMNALRSLMMMVTLTRPETSSTVHDRREGPLRRLFEDMQHLNRRMHEIESKLTDIRRYSKAEKYEKYEYEKYPDEKYLMTATQVMAAQIDQDVLNQFNKGLVLDRVKGLK